MTQERRVSIALEKLSDPNLEELKSFLMKKDRYGEYRNASKFTLKVAAGMFVDSGKVDVMIEPYRNRTGPDIPVIADLSATGGYEAIVDLATNSIRNFGLHSPTIVFGSGLGQDGVEYAIAGIKKKVHDADFMLSGALPENDPVFFEREFRQKPHDYTCQKIDEALDLGIFGVFAAAKYADKNHILGLAAGVSIDGKPYESDGVMREAISLDQALLVSRQVSMGSALATTTNVYEALVEIVNIVG